MNDIICVRGGGDLATGVIQKLWRAGFSVCVLEISEPTAIRRTVALSSAVNAGAYTVEDVTAVKVGGLEEVKDAWGAGLVPVLVDPDGVSIGLIKPGVIVDAIIAKYNTGTRRGMAPITIALGPGFKAPDDVDAVIETMRGHSLGRLILDGAALDDTGTPGEIAGHAGKRVLRAPRDGTVEVLCDIGTIVKQGQTVCTVGGAVVTAPFEGIVRGMIYPGSAVTTGFKIGDIDARTDVDWHTISDKARALGGAALETVLYLKRLKNLQ